YFFSAFMLVLLSIFLHLNISDFNIEAFSETAIGNLFLSVSLQLGLLLVFFFLNRNKDNKITSTFSWKKLGLYSLISVVSFFLLSPIISCSEKVLNKLGLVSSGIEFDLNIKNYFLSLIAMVLFPAICEELLFRGLIFKGMKQHGKNLSITLSAIAFSIFHMSIFQTIYPLLFGLLLGIIMYKENNIFYTITMHFINNFLSLTFMFLGIDFFVNHWLFFVLAILLFSLFLFGLIKLIKSTKETSKEILNKSHIVYLTISFAIMIVLWIILNVYGK
ncbi:MAG: CPBP family intramembrane metalloprotease, partial [Clostridia bacterium]|nr:CPBP family intramembrane metalloprotease [Clostridia bacterium]